MRAVARGWRARHVAIFGRPENLAVFRITVAAALLLAPDIYDAPRWAALPAGLRNAPAGLGRALAAVPLTPASAQIALAVIGSALAALLGLFARPALAIAAVSSLYLLGIPQRYGPATHDHHLVWFLALLAASPCADALSIDAALLRRRAPAAPRAAIAYALPLFAGWALVGIVFFFPGLWKLRASGLSWIASDNLRDQLYWKWAQAGGFTPAIRVDRSAALCRLAAFCVVAFELSFVFLIPSRRLRAGAVGCAYLFHLATAAVMRVSFFSLVLCYGMFFDWSTAVRWLRGRLSALPLGRRLGVVAARPARARTPIDRRPCSRRTLPAILVGSILVAGNVVQGARGAVDDWPFACYPTFQAIVGTEMPVLAVYAVRAGGERVALPTAPVSTEQTPRQWALAWSMLSPEAQGPRFESYWRALERREPVRELARGARSIRFYRAWISVIPEDRGKPPAREELLYEIIL